MSSECRRKVKDSSLLLKSVWADVVQTLQQVDHILEEASGVIEELSARHAYQRKIAREHLGDRLLKELQEQRALTPPDALLPPDDDPVFSLVPLTFLSTVEPKVLVQSSEIPYAMVMESLRQQRDCKKDVLHGLLAATCPIPAAVGVTPPDPTHMVRLENRLRRLRARERRRRT